MKIVRIIKINTMYYVREMIFISNFRKILIKFTLYLSCVMAVLVTLTMIQFLKYHYDVTNKSIDKIQFTKHSSDMKYILVWKPPKKTSKDASKLPEGRSLFLKQSCKFTNCFITYDKNLLQSYSQINAVMFKVRDIEFLSPKDINLARSADQSYIFYSLRSSESHPVCNVHFDNFFNWTWTYKLDSDIPNPFINIFDSQNNLVGPKKGIKWITGFKHNELITMETNKTRAVAWIVTKCKTRLKYQDFVNEMKKELLGYNHTIDVYGPCGDRRCPKGHIINCFKFIEKRYFFQMILEEAFVDDYVSELMVYAMSHLTVPIVLGSSSYKNFLPPGSYINAHIFDMKKLGAIIDFLIKYPVTYKYFFDWKNHYYYTTRSKSHICNLCAKLNDNTKPKVYKNFREWWNPSYKDLCQQSRLHNMFKN